MDSPDELDPRHYVPGEVIHVPPGAVYRFPRLDHERKRIPPPCYSPPESTADAQRNFAMSPSLFESLLSGCAALGVGVLAQADVVNLAVEKAPWWFEAAKSIGFAGTSFVLVVIAGWKFCQFLHPHATRILDSIFNLFEEQRKFVSSAHALLTKVSDDVNDLIKQSNPNQKKAEQ